MTLEEIRETARSHFNDITPAHDWKHVQRVYKLGEKLAKEEDADIETVRLAILLHDIGRAREDHGEIEDHAEWGAEKSREILESHGYEESLIEDVVRCIRAHRYSTSPEPETLEAKIVSDADNLDALGASGIARTFTYAGEHGNLIADPDLPVDEDDSEEGSTAYNHLQKKILGLKERIYTDSGMKIARDRHEFVEEYVERLSREMKGEV